MKNRPIHPWPIDFNKGVRTIQQGKNSLFKKWCWDSRTPTWKKMDWNTYFMLYTNINFKWINVLERRAKTLKKNNNNIGINLCDLGFSWWQLVKNPPAMTKTWVRSLDWEDPLEKGMATHSNISGLDNSMDYVHKVVKSWTLLRNFPFHLFTF